jgi:hypothetical protein
LSIRDWLVFLLADSGPISNFKGNPGFSTQRALVDFSRNGGITDPNSTSFRHAGGGVIFLADQSQLRYRHAGCARLLARYF